MFTIIQEVNIIVPLQVTVLCSLSRLSSSSFMSSLNSSRSVFGGLLITPIVIFRFLLNKSLSISMKIDSLKPLFNVMSGRLWYSILLRKKIPTPPPDLSVLWVSIKLYPSIVYKSEFESESHVSVTPITANWNSRFCKHISKDVRLAFILRIFIWHSENTLGSIASLNLLCIIVENECS